MAEILNDDAWITRDGYRKYPWDEWLDGKTRLLRQGEDFSTERRSFRALAATTALRRGIRIRTLVQPDGVLIQALPASTDTSE